MAAAACTVPTMSAASAELGIKIGNSALVVADNPETVMERLVDVLQACKAAYSRPKQKPYEIKACVLEDHDYTAFAVKLFAMDDDTFVLDLTVSSGRSVMAKAFFQKAVACLLMKVSPAPFDIDVLAGFFKARVSPDTVMHVSSEMIEESFVPIVSGLASVYFDRQLEMALTACSLLSKPRPDEKTLAENYAAQSTSLFDALCNSLISSKRRVDATVKAIAFRALTNAFYHHDSVGVARFTSRLDVLSASFASMLVLPETQEDLWLVLSKRSIVEIFTHLAKAAVLLPDAVTTAVQRCLDMTGDVVLGDLCRQFLA